MPKKVRTTAPAVDTPEQLISPLFEPEVRAQHCESMSSESLIRLRSIESHAKAARERWTAVLGFPSAKRKAAEIPSDTDSEDGGDVAPFDLGQQQRPKLPMYHPAFQQSEKDIQSILQVFADFLSQDHHNDEANYLYNQLTRERLISYENEIRLAVTGDTGSGKSATINALLGEDLTPEGDSGSACTNVVTEFRQKKLSQAGAVHAEVQFYCLEHCTEALVAKWFNEWISITERLMQPDSDEAVDDHDHARRSAALECLEHLFGHHVDSFESFMLPGKQMKDHASILKQLLKWTVEIHEQFIADGEFSVHLTANTHSDMREQLRPFRTRAANSRYKGKLLRFSPWPFVEIIRYYVDTPLLQDGICLADVPGAKDVNVYRVANAEAYLQQCEMTVVVVDIKRATSDQSFRQHYLDAHKRRYHGSVILVATRSDEMNDDGGSTLQLDSLAEDELAPIEEELFKLDERKNSIETQMNANKNTVRDLRSKSEQGIATEDDQFNLDTLRAKNKDLAAEKKRMAPQIICLVKQRKRIRIACRNRIVATGMKRMYTQATRDDAGAATFCVSNRMYMRYRRGYNESDPDSAPTIGLEDTQIPALFKHISGIPSQGRVAVLEHLIMFKVPMLLNVFRMSCSKSTAARVEHVTKILDVSIKKLESEIEALPPKFCDRFLQALKQELSDFDLRTKFEHNAAKQLEKVSNLNGNAYASMIKKRGKYCQKKKNIHHDLNAALLEPLVYAIDNAFHPVIDRVPAEFKGLAAQTVKAGFNELNRSLKDDPQALAGDAYRTCIGDKLAMYEKGISHKVENARKRLRQGLIEVHQKAKNPNENGYVYEAMATIYDDATAKAPIKRQTAKETRHTYLERHITGADGPFAAIVEFAEEDVNEIIERICGHLNKEMVGMLKDIRKAFESQKSKKENDTPEGQLFRKELHELVDEASRILNGVIRENLEKCKEYR